MTINEILDEYLGEPKLHRVWEISIKDTKTILKRYGAFCQWDKLVLEKDSKEVYRIEFKAKYKKENKTLLDEGIRKEFFFNKNKVDRKYVGNQFSFIEYLEMLNRIQDIPNKKVLISKNIEGKIIDLYSKNAKMIFNFPLQNI